MLTSIAILGAASVGAALVTGARVFGLRRIVKHSTKTDVAFTAGIGLCLAGTITGLATAIVAGLMMALVLTLLKSSYKAVDRLTAALNKAKETTFGDEHNANGWIYNQAPYV